MQEFYSTIDGRLLHVVNRKEDISSKRVDICPNDKYLQVSCFSLPKEKTFKPHKHIPLERSTDITQESWVVIQGKIKAILYDLDDTILEEVVLNRGDCSITFEGGHNYESLEDDTLVYEYKTGPYFGQKKDKVVIENDR